MLQHILYIYILYMYYIHVLYIFIMYIYSFGIDVMELPRLIAIDDSIIRREKVAIYIYI